MDKKTKETPSQRNTQTTRRRRRRAKKSKANQKQNYHSQREGTNNFWESHGELSTRAPSGATLYQTAPCTSASVPETSLTNQSHASLQNIPYLPPAPVNEYQPPFYTARPVEAGSYPHQTLHVDTSLGHFPAYTYGPQYYQGFPAVYPPYYGGFPVYTHWNGFGQGLPCNGPPPNYQGFQAQPAPQEAFQAQPAPQEAFQAQPAPQEAFQTQPAPQEAFQAQPAPQEAFQAQPAPQETFQAQTGLNQEGGNYRRSTAPRVSLPVGIRPDGTYGLLHPNVPINTVDRVSSFYINQNLFLDIAAQVEMVSRDEPQRQSE